MTTIYDTSSLLLLADNLFEQTDKIVITSITLKELEHIKTSANKDANIKYAARHLLHILDENPDKYECHIYTSDMAQYIERHHLELTDDAKILATAYDYAKHRPFVKIQFCTNDLALKQIAKIFFKDNVTSIEDTSDSYTGYLNITMSDNELADFYTNPTPFGQKLSMYKNQYLNILNSSTGEKIDSLCWTVEGFRPLKYKTFSSR